MRASRQDHENFFTILSERTVYTRVSYFINTCISNITYISIGASLSRRAEEGVKRVRPGVVVSAGVGG